MERLVSWLPQVVFNGAGKQDAKAPLLDRSPMLTGAFLRPHTLFEKCNDVVDRKLFAFGHDTECHCLFVACVAPNWCLLTWGVGTGENIFCSWGIFQLVWGCNTPTRRVPEERADCVRDLTRMIVKADTYPRAHGGFGDVWSCQLRRDHCQLPPERVAVKAIRPVITNDEEFRIKKKAFEQELNVWFGLDHQNVLPLYGITHGFGPFPAFVSPWSDNGTLSEYLENSKSLLDLRNRITLLGDIADGLHYLHSRNIIHGDLSGSNILIDKDGRACLSDFGRSTLFESVSDTVAPEICYPGNIRWAAPELLDYEERTPTSQSLSQQVDVYSFGSVMLQTLSGKLPFHGVQRVAEIVIKISRGDKPPRESGWDGRAIPEVLWVFVESCWASPPKRPSSQKIVRFIRSQLSSL